MSMRIMEWGELRKMEGEWKCAGKNGRLQESGRLQERVEGCRKSRKLQERMEGCRREWKVAGRVEGYR